MVATYFTLYLTVLANMASGLSGGFCATVLPAGLTPGRLLVPYAPAAPKENLGSMRLSIGPAARHGFIKLLIHVKAPISIEPRESLGRQIVDAVS